MGSTGMDLRTYIATAALQGIIVAPGMTGTSPEERAEYALLHADALIAELNKPKGTT